MIMTDLIEAFEVESLRGCNGKTEYRYVAVMTDGTRLESSRLWSDNEPQRKALIVQKRLV